MDDYGFLPSESSTRRIEYWPVVIYSVLFAAGAFLVLDGDGVSYSQTIFGGIVLLATGLLAVLHVRRSNKISDSWKLQKGRFLLNKMEIEGVFIEAVSEYRDLVIGNYNSPSGTGKSMSLLEREMEKLFSEAPEDVKEKFLLVVLETIGRPVICRNDNNGCRELNFWLQRLAFRMHDKLAKKRSR